MPPTLTWESDERCVVGGTTFQILPADLLDQKQPQISMEGADFLLLKDRALVEQYARLFEELRPQNIVELGILEGGGTALLFELAQPRTLVAIDRNRPTQPTLYDRLAEIVAEAFGDEPLDLVVDDCSHMYELTRASFNELFPRLRPGGLFVIEDWPWAHSEPFARMWADQVPLTRLVVELVLAVPSVPDLIADVRVESGAVQVRRGGAEVDPRGFDISAGLDEVSRSFLPPA
jgi:SAM-dependent methyltransferase